MATLSTHFHSKTITLSSIPKTSKTSSSHSNSNNRRLLILTTTTSLTSLLSSSFQNPSFSAESNSPKPSSSLLSGIANTKSWFQFYGDGFVIRVPPYFQDVMEPEFQNVMESEDYNSGLSLYGDKVKPKTFAARFASPDGSEVVSVVTRPTNQLKITFLEAKDITDLGSLKEAAKIFIPGGATLYSARAIKIKEDEGLRNYYFYEFEKYDQHVALVAAVNSGKAIIAGATAPQNRWIDVGVKLRSAAISLTVL